MAAVTRLGLYGGPRRPYADFYARAPHYTGGENAVYFDGTGDDYLARSAQLDGVLDGKKGCVSGWVKYDNEATDREPIFVIGFDFVIRRLPTGELHIRGRDNVNTVILDIQTLSTLSGGVWYHYAASWDLSTTTAHLYLNGASDYVENGLTDLFIDYKQASHGSVGIESNLGKPLSGCVSDLYVNTAEYMDLSVAGNLAKFYDNGAVDLGANGEAPFGYRPIVYLNGDKDDFQQNRGYGGDFSVVGTLVDCSDTPASAGVGVLHAGFIGPDVGRLMRP